MPEMKKSAPAVMPITIVAPKSGSATASPIITATRNDALTAPFQNLETRQPARSMNTAVAITTASLPNSLG